LLVLYSAPRVFSPGTLSSKTNIWFDLIWLIWFDLFQSPQLVEHLCLARMIWDLRWLETVSSTFTLMGRYNYSLSPDATIMVSKNCPITGEHVVIIFENLRWLWTPCTEFS